MGGSIPITNLAQGMMSDDPKPGTLRDVLNLLPWRGALRRRGPIRFEATFDTAQTAITNHGPSESICNKNNRGSSKALFSQQITTAYGTLHAADGPVLDPSDLVTITGGCSRMIAVDDEVLVFPKITAASSGSIYSVMRWAGGDPASTLATASGNLTLTAGSRHATFATAGMAASAVAAGFIRTTSGAPNRTYGVRKLLTSTTVLLSEPARANYSSSSWSFELATTLQCNVAAAGGGLFEDYNNGAAATGENFVSAAAGCMHQSRLIVGNIVDYEYSGTTGVKVHKPASYRWSALPEEVTATHFAHIQNFNDDAIQTLPGSGGPILGMHSLNGSVVFIRRSSVQVVAGGLATDGTDIGASVNTIAESAGAGGFHAWEAFEGGVAFADEKGVYVWDGSQITNLTRGKIEGVYRKAVGQNADRLVVQCPGNRIVVSVSDAPNADESFVFDLNVGGWFRVAYNAAYGRIADTGTKYLALRSEAINLGGGDIAFRLYDMRSVFEDLGTASEDRFLDEVEDGVFASDSPSLSLLTNPLALADGWQQGRVSSVGIVDGGVVSNPESIDYQLRLLRGAIYSSDYDDDLSGQVLSGPHDVPQLTDNYGDSFAELLEAMTPDAWWRCDSAGSTMPDASGNGRDLTITGSPTTAPGLVVDPDGSRSVEHATGRIAGASLPLQSQPSVTFGLWFSLPDVTSVTLAEKGTPPNNDPIVDLNSAGRVRFYSGFGYTPVLTGTTVLQPGTVYFLTVTAEELTVEPFGYRSKLYLNGQLEASGDSFTTISFPSEFAPFVLPAGGGADEAFMFLDRVLTADEIAALYVAGSTGGTAGASRSVDQRVLSIRADGAEDATHAMVELSVSPGDSAASFAYGVSGLGLVVEDNPSIGSA